MVQTKWIGIFLQYLIVLTILWKDSSIISARDLIQIHSEDFPTVVAVSSCGLNEYLCKDKLKCLSKDQICDQEQDCFDGSDEANCAYTSCRPGSFQCKDSKKCLPAGWKCDSTPDCGFGPGFMLDLSDEEDEECHNGNPCAKNFIKCQDGFTCIPISNLCDMLPDCPEGSDESEYYCGNSTICNNALHCKYGCKPSEKGPICYCPIGKEYNGSDCVETNKCIFEDTCEHICNSNTDRTLFCECLKGYDLINTRECKARDEPVGSIPLLLSHDLRGINWHYLNGSVYPNYESYKSDSNTAIPGLTFDHFNQTVCWINHSNVSATMRCASSTNLQTFWDYPQPYLYSFEDVYEVTHDWVSSNFYFMDDGRELIFMCNNRLDICKAVVDVDVSKPRSIALDPAKGFMFFTVWGRSGAKLEKANLDGSNRRNIVSSKIVYPEGLTLDLPKSEIFWVDRFLDAVERIDYSGGNRRTMYRGIQHLRHIAAFERLLYILTSKEIVTFSKFNPSGKNYTVLVGNLTSPIGLHVYHRQSQPFMHDSRSYKCQDLSITWNEPPHIKCLCREGFLLAPDQKTCKRKAPAQFLLFAKSRPGGIRTISLQTNATDVVVPIVDKVVNAAIDYDVSSSKIYYSDSKKFRIMSRGLYSTSSVIFLDKGISHSEGIAVDWAGRNLFWSDENLKVIYVTHLDHPEYKKLLIDTDLNNVKSIVVHPKAGLLFWSCWSKDHGHNGWIETAWLNGEKRTKVVTNLTWPLGLTLDPDKSYLYWADLFTFKIERLNIKTNRIELVYQLNQREDRRPLGMSFYKGGLYVTTSTNFYRDNHYSGPNGNILYISLSKTLGNTTIQTLFSTDAATQVKVFDPSLQKGENGCSGNNECPELCFGIPEAPFSACECRDGYRSTSDGKACEEINDYRHPLACNASEFQCANFPKCISFSLVCNSVDDCGDSSDEESSDDGPCAIESGLCGQNFFHCGNGKCIPKTALCNGRINCEDGSDELHTYCGNSTATCHAFEFQCHLTKRCIPLSWVCDGAVDCSFNGESDDASDEHDQCVHPECTFLQFQCDNKLCVPLESVCNGINDCAEENPSDERNCVKHCNATSKFYCAADSKCLESTQICDGICQCSDASDEYYCYGKIPLCAHNLNRIPTDQCQLESWFDTYVNKEECKNITCGHNTWQCVSSRECIPHSFRCDSQADCKDASDEIGCLAKVPPCQPPSSLCDSNTRCININQLCNGVKDCADGSDEGSEETSLCHEKQCETKRNNCSDSCHNSPDGHVCFCQSGKHLSLNKSMCIEDHPCDQWGTCSQICRRIGPRYHCLCLPGYDLKDDGFTCVSSNIETPYLIFSNRHELRGINLKNLQFNSLISNLRNSIALDFFYDSTKNSSVVFWTDVVDDRIYRGNLVTGSLINIEVVIQTGLATAEGLAVDWIGNNLYWVESNLDQIEVAKLNGSFRKTLISGQMVSPRSIALDPREGMLFWTDWDSEAPRIESASMSGDDRKIVIRVGDMSWPNGLTLDLVNKRVFYCDARLDSIHTIKYDGTDFQTVLHEHEALSHPFAITMFESSIYYSDWRSNSIIKANKFNGSNVTTIHRTYTQPFDVKVIHPSRQPRVVSNPCQFNNANCSHLCLLSFNQTYKCGCPHLMTLGSDKKNCITYEKMLLFSRLNEIRAVYLNEPYYYSAPPLSLNLIVNPANLHFVAKNKQIFFLDGQSGDTKRANISNPSIKTLIDAASGKPLAMSVDWISNLIFVALQTPLRTSISVTDLEGQYFSTIITGKNELRGVNSIAVNPYKGQIYFPDGTTKGQYTIQISQMDGQKRQVLSNNRDNPILEKPISLSYDFRSDRVYWLNYNDNREIQYYDFSARQVKTVLFNDIKPNVITIYDSFIYFASEKEDAIMKGNKTTGGVFTFVRNDTENVYSIRVYDPDEQIGSNPCAVDKGGCEHLCLPSSATKKVCKCALGFQMDPRNSTRCKSVDTVLLYADSSGIRGLSPEPDSQDDLLVPIPLVSFATDIDVDERNSYLYWLDNDKGRISRIRRDGTGRELVLSSLDAVLGLAIDWSAGNMYWANPKDPMIEIAHVNGSSRYVLITSGLDKPMSLAVDPIKGYLFWSDIAKGQIERAQLDGTNRKVIIQSEGLRATDIALDIENSKIFWSDSIADKIESSTYDGEDRKIVYSGEAESHVHSPIVGNSNLYWIDMGHQSGSIMSAPLDVFAPIQVIRKSLGVTVKDLSLFTKGKQQGRNACGINNGGCADLCLFNGTHPVCICAHGKIGTNGKSCENYDAFIAYSRVQSIETIHVRQEVTPNSPYPPIQSTEYIRNAIGLAFDINEQRLFYSDVQLGTINSVFFNGTNFTVVAEKQGSVEGLYFEASHQDLYWTCSNDASINRLNPYSRKNGGKSRVEKVLKLGTNDRPRGIACDPCQSLIFWTNWDANRPSIQRSYMSGARLESIVNTDIRMPNGLCLDQPNSHLYFIDARLDKIERVNYDGSNRKVIGRDKPKHAFAIAVHGDYLYWSDWVLLSILRANKHNGDDVVVLRKDIPKPMGIVAVSNQNFSCTTNPCQIENGGCMERCRLGGNRSVTCSCHDNKNLIEEGRCVFQPNRKGCGRDEFQCASGVCIPYVLSCNQINHCPDGSDEDDNYCRTRSCKEGFFSCPSSTRCILVGQVCDGRNDCGNLDDEKNCNCTDSQFRCGDGRCISKTNESDDGNCTIVIHTIDENGRKKIDCPPNALHCKSLSGCYLSTWKCDHENDCSDGSDEEDCDFTCRPGQFRCNTSNDCINGLFQCDGSPDCQDGSDEAKANCENRTCDESIQFQCNNSKVCIPIQWKCDGDADCPGGDEDENPAQCVNVTKIPLNICPPSQFQCSNGLCVLNEYYCDRDDDCGNFEDEPASCHYNKFDNSSNVCGNGRCAPKTTTCNKKGSDEKNCGSQNYCTAADEFLCKNGVCINESLLCDGQDDCGGDFSDEISCNINECEQAKTCQHRCIDKKIGYACECLTGYVPDLTDPKLCVDIDECIERPCSQICQNSIGSYSCSCIEGYLLKENLHSCKSMSSDPVKIMFSNQYYIRMVDLNHQEILVAHNLTNAVALDFDFSNSCLYYSDVTSFGSSIKRICNMFSNQSNIAETLHHITLQSPDGIAVDWIAGNLYFCDKGTDTIEVSKLNGSFRKILVSEGLQEPRAIALDPFHGHCFWSDWGESPHIGRIGMDGSNLKILISENLGWPNALTVSYETNELWWADAREDYIAVSNLDGKNQKIVYSRVSNPTAKVHHIFSMSVFEETLYYSDWELKSIERCHKYTGSNHSTLTKTIHRPMDVKVYHPARQPPLIPNPCENNGGCPTLCLLKPGGGRTCACPENFILSQDEKECKPNCTSSQFVCEKTFRCLPLWWKCDGQDDCGDGSDEPDGCPEFRCTPGQYQCSDGKTCLHPAQICDNKPDCQNATDEENCDSHTCFSTQFKCNGNETVNPFCIPSYKVCDSNFDCPAPAHEDEVNCLPTNCAQNQFKCNNSRCISSEWVCDGDKDCLNGEDELQDCSTRKCEENQFRCSTGKCIPTQWICDGEMDCRNSEDESLCEGTESATCDPTYFKCADNKCIPGRWRCDFDEDCRDASDELDCVPRNCSESEFRCKDGRCIRGSYRCNGEYNCGMDKSDEENCNLTCSSDEFTCTNPKFCIPLAFTCDGENDCSDDSSDELNCTNMTCHPDQFMCKSGSNKCVNNAFLCDNENDCFDGSDESPELCASRPCAAGQFRCSNSTCISYSKVCDNIHDCPDGKDEFGPMCVGKFSCQGQGQFLCANKLCINSSLSCDGQDDCGDNSDEKDCALCPFASCSQICIFKKPGIGTNSGHNYSCECASGYRLSFSLTSTYCKAMDEPPYMLVASENDLKRTDPYKPYDNETSHIFSSHDSTNKAKIESLDYIMDKDSGVQIFWSSMTLKAIQSLYQPKSSNSLSISEFARRKRATENVRNIITGLEEPRGIAICWITQRLYFIDSSHDTLSVSSLDGRNRIVLINKGMNEPHDIVVDPASGRMFWSDLAGRIEVAMMDGTHRKLFLTSPCPTGLTIDYATNPKRIYWSDIKSHSIESATLNGKDRRVVRRFIGAEFKPYHIDVFEDTLYITTYHSNRILKMNKFGKGNHVDITQGLMNAADVLIIQSKKQKLHENPCEKISCTPPGICLINATDSGNCVCPDSQAPTQRGNTIFQCNATTGVTCDLSCKQGTCILDSNGPSCQCNPLYEGVYCEKYRCSGYCYNKGLCYHSNDISNVQPGTAIPLKCNCLPMFTGSRCETPYVSCRGKCENNGTCNEAKNFCECTTGFAGLHCERCEGLECENGGTCTKDKRGKPYCSCVSGYHGSQCQLSKCDCNNRGKCKVENDIAKCSCNQGYNGSNCELDLCQNYCKNGGTCLKKPSGIVCNCPPLFKGLKCEVNPCDCLKCRPGDWNCQCPTSGVPAECISGTICPTDFCRNGGICSIVKNTPVCKCPDSWIGIQCEISENPKKNPCVNHCFHNGICIMANANKKPTCACLSEWIGTRCHTRNNCLKYCFNGGTCALNSEPNMEPTCTCPEAFAGPRCQALKIERSVTSPQDGGITWILVLVFIVVAVAVAGFSGCAAYFVMRRKQGRPFMHVRMHDNGTVEINNPMFLKEDGDDGQGSEPSLAFDSDKVLLQGTNFANPLYQEGEQHGMSDEKKSLLQSAEDFSSCGDHPLADPLA